MSVVCVCRFHMSFISVVSIYRLCLLLIYVCRLSLSFISVVYVCRLCMSVSICRLYLSFISGGVRVVRMAKRRSKRTLDLNLITLLRAVPIVNLIPVRLSARRQNI